MSNDLRQEKLATVKRLADGNANKEIATSLDISERTVKTHRGADRVDRGVNPVRCRGAIVVDARARLSVPRRSTPPRHAASQR
jgi:FixJ family two-component response regulator